MRTLRSVLALPVMLLGLVFIHLVGENLIKLSHLIAGED